jgi:hypothetical protein
MYACLLSTSCQQVDRSIIRTSTVNAGSHACLYGRLVPNHVVAPVQCVALLCCLCCGASGFTRTPWCCCCCCRTPSPGPAAYVVNEALTKHHSGAAVLTSRAVAHQYISPLHEQSEVRRQEGDDA